MNPPRSRTKTFSRIGSVARRLERLSRKQLASVRFRPEPPNRVRSSFNSGRSSSTREMRVKILSDRSKLRYPNRQRNRVENAVSAGSTPARSTRYPLALVEERANSPGSEPGGRKAVWVQVPPGAPRPEILGLHAGLAEWFQATVFQTVHGGSIPSIRTNGSSCLEPSRRATRSGRAGGLSHRRRAGSSPAHVSMWRE